MVIGILIGVPMMGGGGNFTAPTGPTNGILLEDGTSFLLAESGDFLVQE